MPKPFCSQRLFSRLYRDSSTGSLLFERLSGKRIPSASPKSSRPRGSRESGLRLIQKQSASSANVSRTSNSRRWVSGGSLGFTNHLRSTVACASSMPIATPMAGGSTRITPILTTSGMIMARSSGPSRKFSPEISKISASALEISDFSPAFVFNQLWVECLTLKLDLLHAGPF